MDREYFYKLECETDPTNKDWRAGIMCNHKYWFEPNEGIYTSEPITNMRSMFRKTYLTELDSRDWYLRGVTNMVGMFEGATGLTSVNLSDTSSVTNMVGMFEGATSLKSVSLPDTGNVTNMVGMFNQATSLTSVNLPDTSSVTTMNSMFFGATSFDQDIRNWNVDNVTYFTNMFRGATVMQEKFGVGDTPTREWFNKGE